MGEYPNPFFFHFKYKIMALVQQLPILDLNLVDLRNMNVIAISDVSTYLTTPTTGQYSLQITPPQSNTINIPFTPLSVNIYKCVDLGLTCSDSGCTPLPDGIYDILYTVVSSNTPPITTSIRKSFIKIDHIKCAYQHAFLALDLECICHDHAQELYMKELERADLYITGSVAECNRGNNNLSFKYYQKSEFILNNLACKYAGKCNDRGFFNGCGCK